ncbi:26221_t:CDS:1, partial [Gigaspora margarita]
MTLWIDEISEASEMWRTGEPCILDETGKISELGEINEMMNWKKAAEYRTSGKITRSVKLEKRDEL